MNNKHFPLEFQKALINHEMDHARLEKVLFRQGFKLSKQFIGMLASGKRNCTPQTLSRICQGLQAHELERRALNLAAARDVGYEL